MRAVSALLMQQFILAIASSLAATATLLGLIGVLRRRLRIVGLLSVPLRAAALAAGLKILTLFDVARFEELDNVVSWVLIFVAVIAVLRIAGLYFFEVHLHSQRGLRLPPLLPQVAMWTAYLVTALIVARAAFPQAEFTAVVATSAVTSLVLGLALQPILGNFFSGIVISLEQPFRINDWIQVGDIEGRVVDINWRTTQVRTRDNDNLVIPNSAIAEQQIINYYYPHPLHMERIHVGVHYRTAPYRVKQAILDACKRVEGVLEKPSTEVFLLDFGDSAIIYEVRIWMDDFKKKPRINNEVRTEIWSEFKRRSITIPFPIRTLEIEPLARQLEIVRPRKGQVEEVLHSARLFVASGPEQGASIGIEEEPVMVGRSGSCTLVIADPKASKEHLRIEWKNGWLLTDLKSSYGTRINGRKVAEQQKLKNLDRVQIGDTELVFETDES